MHKTRCVCIYDACCRLWRATNERQSTRSNDPSYVRRARIIIFPFLFRSRLYGYVPLSIDWNKDLHFTSIYVSLPFVLHLSHSALWLLARGCRCSYRRIDIYSEYRGFAHTLPTKARKKKKYTSPWVEPECKNITAPWEITRVEIPGRTQAVLNARIMKMPIRSPDVLDTRLYCIRRKTQLSDSGVFVNIKRNQRAIFASGNLWSCIF